MTTWDDLDRIEGECQEPMPLRADGEDLGDVVDRRVRADRDAVSVLVWKANRRRR